MNKFKLKNVSMFFIILRFFPGFVIGELLYEIFGAFTLYAGSVLLLKYIVNSMMENRAVFEMLVVLVAYMIFQTSINIYSSFYKNVIKPRKLEDINKYFYYKMKNISEGYELYVYDDTDFYDKVTYSSAHIGEASTASVSYISRIISNSINIVLILSLFLQIGCIVSLIVCLAVGVSMFLEFKMTQLNNIKKYDLNSVERKKNISIIAFFHVACLWNGK